MHAFYYHHYLLDYVYYMHYQHLHVLLQAAQENIKESARAAPPLQLPHGKQKAYQDSLQEGTYQRHFHQIKLAVHDINHGRQNALASLKAASPRSINPADRAHHTPSHLHHSCK